MTSKIIVNNIEADAGVSTVTFGSDISASKISTSSTSEFSSGLNVTGGSVGIGTDNPSTSLHLLGSNTASRGQLSVAGSAGAGARVTLYQGSTFIGHISGDTTNGIFHSTESTYPIIFGAGGSERARVTSTGNVNIANGNLVFSTSGTGIDFSATANSSGTMTSELLSDYEEGTWTPTTNGATLTVNHARYRRIGSLVYVTCSLDVTVGGSNEAAHIYGLPFSVDSSTGNNYVASESRRINEDPTILYSIGYAASSIANKYVGRQFSSNQISAIYSNSTSTGQPTGSASWQINISGVRTVIYGWYIAA